MNRFLRISTFAVLFLLFGVAAVGQTFEEFSKQIDKDQASFSATIDQDFDAFKKETDRRFNKFVTETDKEFADYLTGSFGMFKTSNEKYEPENAKPDVIPVVEEIVVNGEFIDYEISKSATVYQGPVYPGIKKIEDKNFETRKIDISFLAWPLYFNIDKNFLEVTIQKPSPQAIADTWQSFAKLNYNYFLYHVSEVSNTLNLNQWGYFQLLKEISKEVYPEDKNMQVLFQWAMLSRSRYKVKIGFNKDDLFLLVPSVYKMYNIDFVKVNGINYYVIDGKGEQIQTYEKDFPESDILMDVTIRKPFYTDAIQSSKKFEFNYNNKTYSVKLDFDKQMIDFYKSIPLSDVSVYFNAVVSQQTQTSVRKAFKPVLKGKSDIESANILLSFVQQAFDYKTDQQVFGRERYFFADELLFYPYADCEDRSVLFAYLVKTLLNKEVVALSFPGHMQLQ